MSEQRFKDSPKMNPLIRLVIENPISAFNAAAILIGGAGVYYTNDARMTAAEKEVSRNTVRLERLENSSISGANTIQREISEVKASIRGLESSVQFLVNAQRRRPNE